MFRVSANSKKIKVSDIKFNPQAREATLILSHPVVGTNDALINYIEARGDQSENVIQDKYGNDLDSFKNKKLDNLTDGPAFDPPSVFDAIIDGKTLEVEFDEELKSGKISRKRFKVRAGKKRVKVLSAYVPNGENYVVCELKQEIPRTYLSRNISLSYRDLKRDNKKISSKTYKGIM